MNNHRSRKTMFKVTFFYLLYRIHFRLRLLLILLLLLLLFILLLLLLLFILLLLLFILLFLFFSSFLFFLLFLFFLVFIVFFGFFFLFFFIVFLLLCPILQIEPNRQIEIQLNSSTLMFSIHGIKQLNIYFRSIECSIPRIQLILLSKQLQCILECSLCLLP